MPDETIITDDDMQKRPLSKTKKNAVKKQQKENSSKELWVHNIFFSNVENRKVVYAEQICYSLKI